MNTQTFGAFRAAHVGAIIAASAGVLSACHRTPESNDVRTTIAASVADEARTYVVHDTTVDAVFDAAGTAAPIQQAILSTKLMGSVTEVAVREGDRVAAGQVLVRIDARDLTAKSAQISASIADAEALHRDAMTQANRMRALFADSAATRAQLDAAETGLARSVAALDAARGAAAELGAMTTYSIVRAPFSGIVTKRFVDPGAFAALGAPLVAIQDVSTLRITASATPDIARTLRRGQVLPGSIENRAVRATIEGTVPAMTGNVYTINALVANSASEFLSGSAASLSLPTGRRTMLVVPADAIVREGDLTGVTLRTAQGDERRWVRVGRQSGGFVEVTAGVRAGDRIVLPSTTATTVAGS